MLIEETIKCEDTINVETNVNESQNMNNDDAGDHKQEQTQSEMIENVQSSISLNGEVTHEVDCNEQIAIEGIYVHFYYQIKLLKFSVYRIG